MSTPSPATIPHRRQESSTKLDSTRSTSSPKGKGRVASSRPQHLTQNLRNHQQLEELKNSLPQPKKLDYTPKPRRNRRVTVAKPQ